MVIHSGDYDYENDPNSWDSQINSVLGSSFPYFSSVGNHDVAEWSGYKSKIYNRLQKVTGAQCVGEVGVNAVCTYKGITVVLSGVGTFGSKHVPFIESAFSTYPGRWRICSWHKNQKLMQVRLTLLLSISISFYLSFYPYLSIYPSIHLSL